MKAHRVEVADELHARLQLIAPALLAELEDVEIPAVARIRRNAA